jgi:hypothetical protein
MYIVRRNDYKYSFNLYISLITFFQKKNFDLIKLENDSYFIFEKNKIVSHNLKNVIQVLVYQI